MEIVEVEPGKIKVAEGLERFRKDLGDIDSLVKSFQRTRQIVPIQITRDYELIDGGRRLAACAMAGILVKAVFEDVVDKYEMRMLELEANLHRKDFTPAEKAAAIKELHELKQEKYGEGGSGRSAGKDESWDVGQTAKLLGKSRGTIYNALELADLVEQFPQLKKAKKRSEIKKAARGLKKLEQTVAGLARHKETISNKETLYEIIHGDAVEHMLSTPDNSIHILLTDPLYGIEADRLVQSCAGKPGSQFSTSGYKVTDDTDKAMLAYRILAEQSHRFTVDDAHGYVFTSPEYFWTLRDCFLKAGWLVHVKPLIWIKREIGQCNVPSAWPASCYEMVMYIRKKESTLVQEGKPDWFEFAPVPPSQKRHPYEKPVDLLVHLLERICLPGQIVYDPFAGSGSALEAATKLNLLSIGVDESAEAYANMLERMAEFEEDGDEEDEQETEAEKQKA